MSDEEDNSSMSVEDEDADLERYDANGNDDYDEGMMEEMVFDEGEAVVEDGGSVPVNDDGMEEVSNNMEPNAHVNTPGLGDNLKANEITSTPAAPTSNGAPIITVKPLLKGRATRTGVTSFSLEGEWGMGDEAFFAWRP